MLVCVARKRATKEDMLVFVGAQNDVLVIIFSELVYFPAYFFACYFLLARKLIPTCCDV